MGHPEAMAFQYTLLSPADPASPPPKRRLQHARPEAGPSPEEPLRPQSAPGPMAAAPAANASGGGAAGAAAFGTCNSAWAAIGGGGGWPKPPFQQQQQQQQQQQPFASHESMRLQPQGPCLDIGAVTTAGDAWAPQHQLVPAMGSGAAHQLQHQQEPLWKPQQQPWQWRHGAELENLPQWSQQQHVQAPVGNKGAPVQQAADEPTTPLPVVPLQDSRSWQQQQQNPQQHPLQQQQQQQQQQPQAQPRWPRHQHGLGPLSQAPQQTQAQQQHQVQQRSVLPASAGPSSASGAQHAQPRLSASGASARRARASAPTAAPAPAGGGGMIPVTLADGSQGILVPLGDGTMKLITLADFYSAVGGGPPASGGRGRTSASAGGEAALRRQLRPEAAAAMDVESGWGVDCGGQERSSEDDGADAPSPRPLQSQQLRSARRRPCSAGARGVAAPAQSHCSSASGGGEGGASGRKEREDGAISNGGGRQGAAGSSQESPLRRQHAALSNPCAAAHGGPLQHQQRPTAGTAALEHGERSHAAQQQRDQPQQQRQQEQQHQQLKPAADVHSAPGAEAHSQGSQPSVPFNPAAAPSRRIGAAAPSRLGACSQQAGATQAPDVQKRERLQTAAGLPEAPQGCEAVLAGRAGLSQPRQAAADCALARLPPQDAAAPQLQCLSSQTCSHGASGMSVSRVPEEAAAVAAGQPPAAAAGPDLQRPCGSGPGSARRTHQGASCQTTLMLPRERPGGTGPAGSFVRAQAADEGAPGLSGVVGAPSAASEEAAAATPQEVCHPLPAGGPSDSAPSTPKMWGSGGDGSGGGGGDEYSGGNSGYSRGGDGDDCGAAANGGEESAGAADREPRALSPPPHTRQPCGAGRSGRPSYSGGSAARAAGASAGSQQRPLVASRRCAGPAAAGALGMWGPAPQLPGCDLSNHGSASLHGWCQEPGAPSASAPPAAAAAARAAAGQRSGGPDGAAPSPAQTVSAAAAGPNAASPTASGAAQRGTPPAADPTSPHRSPPPSANPAIDAPPTAATAAAPPAVAAGAAAAAAAAVAAAAAAASAAAGPSGGAGGQESRDAVAAVLGDLEGSRLVDFEGIERVLEGGGCSLLGPPPAPSLAQEQLPGPHTGVAPPAAAAAGPPAGAAASAAIGTPVPASGGDGGVSLAAALQIALAGCQAQEQARRQQGRAAQQPLAAPAPSAGALGPGAPAAALKLQEDFLVSLLMQQQALQLAAARQQKPPAAPAGGGSGLTPGVAGMHLQTPGSTGCAAAAAVHSSGRASGGGGGSAPSGGGSGGVPATPVTLAFPALAGATTPSPQPPCGAGPGSGAAAAGAPGTASGSKRAATEGGAPGTSAAEDGSAQKRLRGEGPFGAPAATLLPTAVTDGAIASCRPSSDASGGGAPCSSRVAGACAGAAGAPLALAVASVGLLPPRAMARRILSGSFPRGGASAVAPPLSGLAPPPQPHSSAAGTGLAGASGVAATAPVVPAGAGPRSPPATPLRGLGVASFEALLADAAPSLFPTPGTQGCRGWRASGLTGYSPRARPVGGRAALALPCTLYCV
jgi:hypothetical protein